MLRAALVLGLLTALVTPAYAESPVGQAAPAWHALDWVNVQRSRTALQPRDLRGRVIYLVLYAPDDPANGRALRSVAKLRARYGRTVAFVALQTAASGSVPRPTQLAYLAQHGLNVPGATEKLQTGQPTLRAAYGAGAGPWAVLIDAQGIVRQSRPVRPVGEEVRAIEALRAPSNPLIGTSFGSLTGLRWLQPNRPIRFSESKLTLLRWWTTNCPHCSTSVPDLSRLASRYAARGLRFVGIYHRKSAFRVSDASIRSAFHRYGGAPHALAVDEGWRMLRPFMQRGRLRRATSISILVDNQGIIRWVHPGPRIHTSTSARYAGPARDLAALDAFLAARLPAPSARATR